MSNTLLLRPARKSRKDGTWSDDDYDVIAIEGDGSERVIGRIYGGAGHLGEVDMVRCSAAPGPSSPIAGGEAMAALREAMSG
jgi:hypothetical protein